MRFSFFHKILFVMLASVFITACIFDTKKTNTIEINLDPSTKTDSIMAGESLKLKGTVKGSGKLMVRFELLNAVSMNVYNSKLLLLPTDNSDTLGYRDITGENEINLESDSLRVVTLAGIDNYTCAGYYQLKISGGVEATGGVTGYNEKFIDLYVRGINCEDNGEIKSDLTSKTDTVAAQNNTDHGSAFDFDGFEAYKVNLASANSDKMDLYYTSVSSTTGDQVYFYNPAQVDTWMVPYQWTKKNDTKFYKITQNFSNIKSKYQLKQLWDDSSAVKQRETIAQGDVFIIKTTDGKTGLIHVKTKSGSDANSYAILEGKIPE